MWKVFRPAVAWILFQRNRLYAWACVRHAVLVMGESPYASHVMFKTVLRDGDPAERDLGMRIGFQWGAMAEARVVYCDHGISEGMEAGIAARPPGQVLEFRYLDPKNIHRCDRCGVMVPPDTNHCGSTRCAVAVHMKLNLGPRPVGIRGPWGDT